MPANGRSSQSAADDDRFAHAVEHQRSGRIAEAVALFCEIVSDEPRRHPALHHLGLLMHQTGANDQAAALIEHAIALDPGIAAYHYDLSVILLALGQAEPAAASLQRALKIDPDLLDAHINLSSTLRNLGRPEEALISARRAVELKPDSYAARIAAGTILMALNRLAEAESEFQQARLLEPTSSDALINLGAVAFAEGKFDLAAEFCRQALLHAPDNAQTHSNLAGALRMLERPEEALDHYDRALALGKPYPETRINRSFLLLSLGRYAEGWEAYEARHEMAPLPDIDPAIALWNGEDLRGKTLLLRSEQGFGDAIQFCRFATPLAALGARVIIEAKPQLVRLLRRAPDVAAVIASGDQLPLTDYHLPMMSAPVRLGTTLETIPAVIPYLRAEPDAANEWRGALSDLKGLKVGIVWAGEARNLADSGRSVPLSAWRPILEVSGVDFVSLQLEDRARSMIGDLPEKLRPLDRIAAIRDFADTAALIEALDLVISVDTATGHLAGALGKPVWLLHRLAGCWRWLQDREDSPWYPSMRIFRQKRQGEWSDVIAKIAADLTRLAATERQ
jgi:tetratricopeptide (TPR) repeat protein